MINEEIAFKVQRCIEGLIFSYKMMLRIYKKMYFNCSKINEDTNYYFDALESCWTFIDAVHRIREILQQFPTISKKDNDLLIFINETSMIEEYRHYIQHLRNELNSNENTNSPVWGSLSWIDNNDNSIVYIVICGTNIKNVNFSSCVFDTVENKWVSKITLSLKDKSLGFDSIYNSVVRYMELFLHKSDISKLQVHRSVEVPIVNKMQLSLMKKA